MQTIFFCWEKRNQGILGLGRRALVWEDGTEAQLCCWVPFVWLNWLQDKFISMLGVIWSLLMKDGIDEY